MQGNIIKDSFSAKQRKVISNERRYCLRHTPTGGYGRSFKEPLNRLKLSDPDYNAPKLSPILKTISSSPSSSKRQSPSKRVKHNKILDLTPINVVNDNDNTSDKIYSKKRHKLHVDKLEDEMDFSTYKSINNNSSGD